MLGRLVAQLVVVLLLSLSGCDKKVIQERVRPSGQPGSGGPSRPIPDLDGSVVVDDDAGVGNDTSEPDEVVDDIARPFTKANLIAAVGNCALAAYQVFERRAALADETTRAWFSDPSEANAAAARAAFRAAMVSFQRVELFRFGPLAPQGEPGGQGLRDEIYAYPNGNLCKVDQQLVDRRYQADDFAASVSTGRGLSALEYLAYYVGTANACASTITINVSGSWAALDAAELTRRRAEYAHAVAEDIAARARRLVRAFAPDGDNFLAELKRAGRGSKVYASEQAALNAISNVLFYVDIELKDYKLALPLGISPDCTSGTTCPEAVESPFARISTQNLASNLSAFRAIFQGCGTDHRGLGFDDWLSAIDHQDAADAMLAALTGAEQAVQALDLPIEQALVQDRAKVQAVYDAVKKLTDLMKTDFVTMLDLGLPKVAEGDND